MPESDSHRQWGRASDGDRNAGRGAQPSPREGPRGEGEAKPCAGAQAMAAASGCAFGNGLNSIEIRKAPMPIAQAPI